MKEQLLRIACACGVLLMVTPVMGHHGTAIFETGKDVTLKGAVTEWVWANPHCFLKFTVSDATGAAIAWVAETQNPVSMAARGWARSSFKAGDAVSVTLEPAKNGAPVGRIRFAVTASGTTLSAFAPEPAPAPQ